jgi:CHAT domain-containing protein/Tfp pilus assembly protein PilF
MNILRMLSLGVLVAMPSGAMEAKAPEPVAIVYSLTGEAWLGGPKQPLRLFDRLLAGTTVEVGPGSRLALAFASGLRYELGERFRVTIGPKDLVSRTGPVRRLPAVPPLPRLLPIAEDDHPGLRAGALRIRAERIAGLYPRRGAATLAGATTLRFEPVAGAGKYWIEVQNPQGNVVFGTDTTVPRVKLPPDALQPGMRYGWSVRTVERVGPVAQGEADFVTLPARIAEARETLRKAVETLGDGESLALLAEVDRSLGLLAEARDGLRAAVRDSPGDAALGAALAELERRLEDESPAGGTGVVVEEVTPASLGARAGFQEGDRLLSWCRAASPDRPCLTEGRFESPFDFEEMDLEQAPRGGVKAFGKRAVESSTWTLLPGSQSVKVRPVLPDNLLGLYQEGRSLAAADRLDEAVARWRSAAVQAKGAGENLVGIWFLLRAAATLAEARHWPQADILYGEAVEQATSLGEGKVAAQILKTSGKAFQTRGSWGEAEDRYSRSLEIDRPAGRDLAVAWTLQNLGTMAAQYSDLQGAETHLRQALAIHEELAPHSSMLAATLRSLGNVAQIRGDLTLANDLYRRAISIQEKLAPESLEMAGLLVDLGSIAIAQGADAGAEELYYRAKAICEQTRPESLEMARALRMLGIAAARRNDQESAAYFLQHALAIEEKLDASGDGMALTLVSLGLQAYARGDRKQAIEYLRHALDLNEKLAPNGVALALNLQNLGVIEIREGQCAAAEAHFQRALAIREKLNPDSLDVARSLRSLGFLGSECGNPAKAEDNYRRALTIQERLAPGTLGYALVLHDLGEEYLRQGRSLSAVEPLCQAADLIEPRGERSSRTEPVDERFFTDCVRALVAVGQMAEAFRVLERGRARTFLAQLAERNLLFSTDLPEEIARRRRELDKELEATQGVLARLSATRDAAEAERLLDRLREIRDQQRVVTAQIRRSSPRLASLQYPESLDLAGSRRALDPGTALLSYLVGEEKSYLFVVKPPDLADPGLSVFTLPIGRKALLETVGSFRSLLQNARSDPALVTARAKELYELLIGPAETRITTARRLLVSANGPLYTLPFAALVRKNRYLVEWKPIHSVLSATVYAELKKTRRLAPDLEESQIVGFGDPAYPRLATDEDTAPTAALDEILTAVRRGLSLDPIPATRQEVETIANLFPRARIYLGREATEERAKTVGSQARLLHFACHGLLDERFPLDSALALTIPEHQVEGQDNGLLHAWEIMESMRLDADLVTLSACDSGLGKEIGGEGLVGLTRAFQFAGARSVLASLWSVSDVSTADLMKRFYGYLRKGRSKDAALRAAQIDLIRSQGFSHPYYWAAFQLTGDWK